MTGKQMIRKFQQNGWKILKVEGSHYTLIKNGQKETVPYHTTELKKGLEWYLLKRLKEVG